MSLPSDCYLRPAQPEDLWPIRWLVCRAMLDPTQLRWSQFWVIEHRHRVIGCGQLRQHGSVQELGSLVVAPAWRGQGLGTALTQQLMQQATGWLYLECLGDWRAEYYQKFGFTAADWDRMPLEMVSKFRLTRLMAQWLSLPLHIMECQPQKT